MVAKSKCGVGVAVLSIAASFAVSPPASADTQCTRHQEPTRRVVEESATFEISEDSPCGDLNAVRTKRQNDDLWGQYQNSAGEWFSGSAGWVSVSTIDNGWDILLTDVVDGTTVRAQSRVHNQHVFYRT